MLLMTGENTVIKLSKFVNKFHIHRDGNVNVLCHQDVQAPEEFVLVDENTDQPPENGATGSAADEPDPTDPLEVAISKMRAMGFEDDSGWLSQLIKAKGYDLNKVLDAIQFDGKN